MPPFSVSPTWSISDRNPIPSRLPLKEGVKTAWLGTQKAGEINLSVNITGALTWYSSYHSSWPLASWIAADFEALVRLLEFDTRILLTGGWDYLYGLPTYSSQLLS